MVCHTNAKGPKKNSQPFKPRGQIWGEWYEVVRINPKKNNL